jgi:uncharacterized protein (TIGR03437 family)
LLHLAAVISLAQTPQISSTSVVNAASYAQPIAPGSLVSIFGLNLASATTTATGQPLPTDLVETSVTVNGAKAPLFFVSPGQIDLQIPSATSVCWGCSSFLTASFVVTTAAGSSALVEVPVSYDAPGIFAADGSGCGLADALNVALDGSASQNSPSNSAAPGGSIALFGTGLGLAWSQPTDGLASSGQRLESGVNVILGYLGAAAPLAAFNDPNYQGLAPALIAVDRIDFQIPPGTREGCSVPVFLLGQIASPTVTISIHSGGGQCSDPPVQSYGRIALIKTVASGTSADGESDLFTATFPSGPGMSAPRLLADANIFEPPSNFVSVPGASRACPVGGYADLSAGSISVASASATIVASPLNEVGGVTYREAPPAGFMGPGIYQISSSGDPVALQGLLPVGASVQAQTAALTAGTVVSPTQPLTVRWTGGDPGTLVTVTFLSGNGLRAETTFLQADVSAGSVVFGAVCTGNTVANGGSGILCSFSIPEGPLEVIVDVTPAAPIPISDHGTTGAVQAIWDYRYIFGGLTLSL